MSAEHFSHRDTVVSTDSATAQNIIGQVYDPISNALLTASQTPTIGDGGSSIGGIISPSDPDPFELMMSQVLAASRDSRQRMFVARDPDAPPYILDQLSQDSDLLVRLLVAKNPATPPETLSHMSHDDHWQVKAYVASNTKTPSESLDELSENAHPLVQMQVASNTSARSKTLDRLARDPFIFVKDKVAANSSTSARTLAMLAKDDDWAVRRNVALNDNSPPQIVTVLSVDNVEIMRDAALYRRGQLDAASIASADDLLDPRQDGLLDCIPGLWIFQ